MKVLANQSATLVLYDDNPDFGGHQVMACYAAEGFARDGRFNPAFLINPDNKKLKTRLQRIADETGNLEIINTPLKTRKLQALRNFLSKPSIRHLGSQFKELNAQAVIAIQGDIEDSCQALLAANEAEIPVFSYIPVPHTLQFMGARLGKLRDHLNAPLFQKPDAFITISESMAALLRDRGVRQTVQIVHNGVDLQRFQTMTDKSTARKKLGLPIDVPLLGLIGRVEFKQKQQDFLVHALAGEKGLEKFHAVIVGSGPGDGALNELVVQFNLESRVHRIPWLDTPELIYPALDLLVIPSRYEGVPLVMIEALACGTPVVGTDRDGMKDILPESWRFESGDSRGLAQAVARCHQDEDKLLPPIKEKIRKEMSLEAFQDNFIKATVKLME